jgi:DNA-binding transcriptional MerR regulator
MNSVAKKRTIGRLSKEAGVKVTTIRYYESIGLMSEPDRSYSGQRIYQKDDVERLNFIRHARELGFSVEAIRELIELQNQPDQNCDVADEIANRHLLDVSRRIRQLTELENELKRMIKSCQGGHIGTCSIIASLSDHENCEIAKHEKLDLPGQPKQL